MLQSVSHKLRHISYRWMVPALLLTCVAFYRLLGETDEETGWPVAWEQASAFFRPAVPVVLPNLDLQALDEYEGLSPSSIKQLPRILLTIIWAGSSVREYMPRFFESVGNQAANNVELLFITLGPTCMNIDDELPIWTKQADNVKVVCLDRYEYWQMHADVLCERWKSSFENDSCNRKTSPLYARILTKLVEEERIDSLHSFYRTVRPSIFRKYIGGYGGSEGNGPDWWGWCDVDTLLGDFRTTFPYDIAGQFDAIFPTNPSHEEKRLVFMRGHMSFIKNSRRTEKLMWDFPALESIETWEATYPLLDGPPEEAHLSAYVCQNHAIDMLIMDGLTIDRPTAYAETGILTYHPDYADAAREIIFRRDPARLVDMYQPTFTEYGKTYRTELEGLSGPNILRIWFNWHYATVYQPHQWSEQEDGERLRDFRRILIRKNGTTVERLEPAVRLGNHVNDEGQNVHVNLRPWLYDHHQERKRLSNYKALPSLALQANTMLLWEESNAHHWVSLVKADGEVILKVNANPSGETVY